MTNGRIGALRAAKAIGAVEIRSYQKRWWAHRRKVKIKAKKKSQLDPRSYDMQRMNASEKMERPEEPNRLEWFFVS